MCRNNNHGGRRCPADTSEARRRRRKIAKLKTTMAPPVHKNVNHSPVPAQLSPGLETLKLNMILLKEEIYAKPPKNMTQDEYDSSMELKLTAFGGQIAEEVEKITGITPDKISQLKSDLEDEIYLPEFGEAIHEANETYSDSLDNIKDLPEEDLEKIEKDYPRYDWDSPLPKLTEETIQSLHPDTLKLLQQVEADKQLVDKARKDFDELDVEYDKRLLALYTENNLLLQQTYKNVIAQLRETGGTVHTAETSDELGNDLINKTAGVDYPTDWLKIHNSQAETFTVKISDSRPNYASQGMFSEVEDDGVEKTKRSFNYVIGTSNLTDKLEQVFGDSSKLDKFTAVHPVTQATLQGLSIEFNGEVIYDPTIHTEKPSTETGWEYKSTLASISLASASMSDEEVTETWTKKYWVKPETTTKKEIKTLSMFKADGEPFSSGKVTPEAIAYHEFAHRLEEVLPEKILPRHERAFLKRRAGKTDENMFDNMKIITNGEFAHNAGFIDTYMGREYYNNSHYEVFSTGIEALYGGSYGGLMGLSSNHTRPDLEHRNFVLGSLGLL